MGKNLSRDTVVYQIYPRSYCDSNGDGIGDIPGIISKLDYIKDLGVNAIWLSPVYESPDCDNGYDISNYKAIHKNFGTMDDFDRLVGEAKQRGIDIIMDLVINHTSDEHEWFKKALNGEEKYKDYYIIKKGKDGKLPNNWGNFFAECPWDRFGESQDEYYLHLFNKKQPDLNWQNPAIYDEIVDIMRFWLEKGVKGFRCDVINVIYKNTLADGKPSLILTGKEHYMSTDGCHKILNRLNKDVLAPYGAWAVGETVFIDLKQAHDLADDSREELDLVFYFEHMECDQIVVKWFKRAFKPNRLMRVLTKWQTGHNWNAIYFENHDQNRFISRFPDSKNYLSECSKMMAGLTLTLRGTPFIYEGQEIGMTNGDFKDLSEIQDVETHSVYEVAKKLPLFKSAKWNMMKNGTRDNARTPMQWNATEGAGFTSGTPWLKINGNHKDINVAAQVADPQSVYSFYKNMIDMRKNDEVLKLGSFEPLYMGKAVYAYKREYNSKAYIAIFNMRGKNSKIPNSVTLGKTIVSNYGSDSSDILKPFEFRLCEV